MKIKGKSLKNDFVDYAVYPRKDSDIVFKLTPVDDWSLFEELCPVPKPKYKTIPGKDNSEADLDDPKYKEARVEYVKLRQLYLYINTLRETDGLVWDKVEYGKPDTWSNFYEELNDLATAEQNDLIERIHIVNCLDEEHIKKARDRFLAGLQTEGV